MITIGAILTLLGLLLLVMAHAGRLYEERDAAILALHDADAAHAIAVLERDTARSELVEYQRLTRTAITQYESASDYALMHLRHMGTALAHALHGSPLDALAVLNELTIEPGENT